MAVEEVPDELPEEDATLSMGDRDPLRDRGSAIEAETASGDQNVG